jgi:hypothetical protein
MGGQVPGGWPDTQTKRTDWAPQTKVAMGGVAGAITILILAVLGKMGLQFSEIEAAALTVLLTFLVQYLVPNQGEG